MRRAPFPLPAPILKSNFAFAVWRAQAAVKFPHPDNERERNDWTWYLRDLCLARRRAMRSAGMGPALGSTMGLGSPWFDGR